MKGIVDKTSFQSKQQAFNLAEGIKQIQRINRNKEDPPLSGLKRRVG